MVLPLCRGPDDGNHRHVGKIPLDRGGQQARDEGGMSGHLPVILASKCRLSERPSVGQKWILLMKAMIYQVGLTARTKCRSESRPSVGYRELTWNVDARRTPARIVWPTPFSQN